MTRYIRASAETRANVEAKFEKIKKGFAPLVDRTKTCSKTSLEYKQFKRDAGNLYRKIKRAEDFVDRISRMKSAQEQIAERTLVKLFGYLGLVESIGTAMVDFALILLILNKRAFHIENPRAVPSIRHATSLKDFEDAMTPLGAKLGFLRQNSLDFFADMIKKQLRNRIAHLQFEIDDNGNAWYKKKRRRTIIDIDSEIRELRQTIVAFRRFLLESGMLKFMKKAALEGN